MWNISTNLLNSPKNKILEQPSRIQLSLGKKNDSNKNVMDARHLNSNSDQSSVCCPLEPLATQLARTRF